LDFFDSSKYGTLTKANYKNRIMKKNILLTGGAQGIGKIVSETLLKEGYSVTVLEIDQEAIDEFREENSSDDMAFFHCDVSSDNDVKSAINKSAERYGNISGLINNAAILNNKPITELTFEEWSRVIGVNLTGSFLCAKYAAPFLRKTNGSIINLCSTRAFQSEPDTEAYSASKGGIFALTHALAISLGPEVRVNCISPGWVDVSGVKKKSKANQYQLTEEDHKQHPIGRVGKADDIARMVLFLLNPENSFITGQNYVIDGGMTRKMIYV
jgi:NAD(P)-dependent dehydrogenase (short-subunit alcohol dehydrogenase family)